MSTRKRKWTRKDALDVLKKHQKNFQSAAEEICEELLPSGFHDEETTLEIEKLERIIFNIGSALGKLNAQDKQRKFRHNQDALEQTFASSSQYSLFQSSQESTQESSVNTFDSQDLFSSLPQSTQKEYRKRNLTDPTLSSESRRRRVKEHREIFRQWCNEQGCSVSELAGLFIHQEFYLTDREKAKIGWELFCGNSGLNPQRATVLEAVWVMEKLGISYSKYTDLRIKFLDRFIFPPAHLVADQSKQLRPQLEVYRNGVRAGLSECLVSTISERLSLVDLSGVDEKIWFSFNYGMDGSGQHSDYSQLSKTHFSTKQVFNVCFALTSIKNKDGHLIWSAASRGHNSPQNIRPLALFPSKESDEVLRDFVPLLDEEIQQIKTEGLELKLPNQTIVKAELEKEIMSMIDGKMIVRLLQLGGSYCTMCHNSQAQCHSQSFVATGFKITRSVDSIQDLALSLLDPESNEITKRPGIDLPNQFL